MASFGVLAALGAGWAVAGFAHQERGGAAVQPAAFNLVDTSDHAVTPATYRGRWILLYFGYAFSPDIGPATLQSMTTALDDLGQDADKIVPLFVTIDPIRDTPSALAQYVRLFDDRLIGLTGSLLDIEKAERAFGAPQPRLTAHDDSGYSFEHSSSIYFINPDGKISDVFPPGTSAEVLETSMASRLADGKTKG